MMDDSDDRNGGRNNVVVPLWEDSPIIHQGRKNSAAAGREAVSIGNMNGHCAKLCSSTSTTPPKTTNNNNSASRMNSNSSNNMEYNNKNHDGWLCTADFDFGKHGSIAASGYWYHRRASTSRKGILLDGKMAITGGTGCFLGMGGTLRMGSQDSLNNNPEGGGDDDDDGEKSNDHYFAVWSLESSSSSSTKGTYNTREQQKPQKEEDDRVQQDFATASDTTTLLSSGSSYLYNFTSCSAILSFAVAIHSLVLCLEVMV